MYYKSVQSGEITDSRREAMEWQTRNGEDIEVYKDGHLMLVLNYLGI